MQLDRETSRPDESYEVRRITWIGMLVNLLLALIKFVAGVLGRSQAVVADAVHSLSDLATDFAVVLGSCYWARPADRNHPHGHRRIETMTTFGIGLLLGGVAVGLAWRAILHVHDEPETPPTVVALLAAALSIGVKEWLYRWTVARGRHLHSAPLIANAWHHRSDALSSIPAVLAVGGAMLGPQWHFIDGLGAIVVSCVILYASVKILLPAFAKLIDSGVPHGTLDSIETFARETPGVRSVHKVRTRYIGCNSVSVDLHVLVDGRMPVSQGHDISEAVKNRILDGLPSVVDVVVHLEPGEADGPDGMASPDSNR